MGTGGRGLKTFRSGEGYQFRGTFSGGGGSTSWHDMLLSSTYWPFSLCKIFKKILTADPELWRCAIFEPNMDYLPETIFFLKINIILMYLLAHFIEQNVKKKFFQWIQSYEDVQLLGPKCPISLNEKFFQKTCYEPCFFHLCLSTCQKLKSDINLLVKYWRLKNTEISLAETHFCL